MGSELIESLSPHEVFRFTVFGLAIPVSDTIVVMWIIMAVIIIFAFVVTGKFKLIPKGRQNIAEIYVEFVNNLAKNNIGHYGPKLAPYLGTILIFLIFANCISLFNIIPTNEELFRLTGLEFFEKLPQVSLVPPTRDVNVTATMAILSIFVVIFGSLALQGPVKWIKSYFKPFAIMMPFKLLGHFNSILSLCFRLFGNIVGAFLIMELLYSVAPVIIPGVLSIYFDIFDGLLQAYIFVFLTSFYLRENLE